MLLYIFLLIILVILDCINIKEKLALKEIVIYSVLMLIALGLGVYYYSDIFRPSISTMLFSLFNIKS